MISKNTLKQREYRATRKTEFAKYQREYMAKHPGKGASYARKYREQNREAISIKRKKHREVAGEKLRAVRRKYYSENKTKFLAEQANYRKKNRVALAAAQAEYRKTNKAKIMAQHGTVQGRYVSLRSKCTRRGWPCLSFDEYQALEGSSCSYCGDKRPAYGYGLDRVDNSQGYALANVNPCCADCNVARSDRFSASEMLHEIGPAIARVKKARISVVEVAGMQDTWQHRIPKASFQCGERISLTFRGYVRQVV